MQRKSRMSVIGSQPQRFEVVLCITLPVLIAQTLTDNPQRNKNVRLNGSNIIMFERLLLLRKKIMQGKGSTSIILAPFSKAD